MLRKYFLALTIATGAFLAQAETYTATNVVVAPLTDAHWTQGAPYNDYSPKGTTKFQDGWEAGCVAIAAAQELYYWQWPWRLGAVHETSHPVLNESNLALRFDGNVPFDWENMNDSYGSESTLKQKHAAAHLVLACQSLVQMQFVSAGGLASKNLPGTMEWYEYAGQVTPRTSDANLAALKADFESGSPVQTGINFKGYGGHEVVGLGYATGTNSVGAAKNLIWLNLGWGGGSDGWYDLAEATDGETIIKSVQLGFRPIKSVQIEPVAPVSGSSVTLKWHLPNCYADKINGFTVATKKLDSAATTWSDDFSTAKGRSSNTNEIRIVNGALKAWCGTASGMYIWDDVIVPTADSVLTYNAVSCYMSGMEARFEVKIDGVWNVLVKLPLGSTKDDLVDNGNISLASFAGKPVQLRFAVEYTRGGIFQHDVANVRIDNLSVSNVKTFETVSTDDTIGADARSTTFSGLENGAIYALAVTPVMSDGSPAVVQTATTTIGTPAATPTINAVTMSPKGSNLVQEGFYADIAMGWNVINVACSESGTSLEAFISHQSVLPQSKIEVVDNGSGNFSINIDATEVAAKWANQKMILTLKATNETGESTYKDVELCLKASGVPENIPGGKVWTSESALFGADNYTAKWANDELPVDGDKVTLLTTDADFGGEMNLNLSSPTTLGYVYATGDGQLKISGTSSELLTAGVFKNDIQVEVATSKLKIEKAVPSANIVIDSGYSLDCEIDQSRSTWIKKATYGYPSALADSALWKGTVVFSGYTAAGQNLSDYGNEESTVRLNGVVGWFAINTTFNPAVELVDDGMTPALNWNNGSTTAKETFKKLVGSGTFRTSGSGGAAERIVINDVDDFTGSFDLSLKRIAIGENDPTTSNNGSITVNSGKSVTVALGKTWKATGGFYFKGNQTLTVNGAINGAISAEGTSTTLALKPTANVAAQSLSFANNTISIEKTETASPVISITGAADLTGATIEVVPENGMTLDDSIALMSAGSFEGVDTATLEGLDGYSLAVADGVLYAKSDEHVYDGPEPTAIWVSGEFGKTKNGYSIALNGNNEINEDKDLVIKGTSSSGATIDLRSVIPDGTNKVTVVYKYKTLTLPSDCRYGATVNFTNTSNNTVYDVGFVSWNATNRGLIPAWHKSNGGAVSTDFWCKKKSNDTPNYTDEMSVDGGYVILSYDSSTRLISGYQGTELSTATGTSQTAEGLGTNGNITHIGLGGPTGRCSSNKWGSWPDLVIEKVAIFVGDAYTQEDLEGFEFPDADPDTYFHEPAAVWYKDFKTDTKGDYTLSVSGATTIADDKYGSKLTIDDKAAVISIPAPTREYTMIIKYLAAPNQLAQNFFAGGSFTNGSSKVDIGILSTSGTSSALTAGYDNGTKTTLKSLGATLTPSTTGGYLLIAHNASGTLTVATGESFEGLRRTSATITDYNFANWYYTSLAVGGPSGILSQNKNGAWNGLEVEKIAIFDKYYAPIDLIKYPEEADTLSIGAGKTWKFAAGETKTYTNIGTLSSGGTIAVTNASELVEGSYTLATWTKAQSKSTGYGRVGTLDVTGLPTGLSAELVYGAKAIYLRVWKPTTQAARGTIKVWPYGDSITEGYNAGGTKANYRVLLAQKLSMLGFNVEMVGCYDKINQQDGIDPSGEVIPDAWKWHSAKHGATAGPTGSAAGRANLCENVDTLCAQAGNPDVVLLLAGANDIVPATGLTAQQVVNSITNIVAHIAANLPDTKIVVGNQLNIEEGYTSYNYDHVLSMIPQVNERLDTYANNLPKELEGKVFLANLNFYVKSGEEGVLYADDHLHPDWWGHDQMAEGWLSVITNQFTATQVFPSATVPAVPTTEELGAAAKSELEPYLQGFKLARRIDVASNINTTNPYAYDGDGLTENIGKVGYFVEYVRADNNAHKWVWVDMDAFGNRDLESVGLPQRNYQQVVKRLHVKSNHNGIDDVAADDDSVTGFIEFSPYDYVGNVSDVSGAPAGNAAVYDWNDKFIDLENVNSGTNACMQVHRIFSPAKSAADGVARGGQVLFAYNNWRSNTKTAEFGIGNFSSHFYKGASTAQTFDYTWTADAPKMNADAYSVKRIEIWTKEGTYEGPDPVAVWVAGEFGDDSKLHGGLEFTLNGNTTNALGQIVIGETTTLGATIKLPDNAFSKASVLVKYELASGGAPVANAAPAGVVSTDGYPILPVCTTEGGTSLVGAYLNKNNSYAIVNNNGDYWPFSPEPAISSGEGYMLFSYHSEPANPMTHGTAFYVGSTINTMTGGNASGLQWKNNTIDQIAIGGPTTAGGARPWAGMVIKGVAVFADEWLVPSDIAFAEFPQSPIEINAYPINGAIVPPQTTPTTMALSCTNDDVEIWYYNASLNEKEANAIKYTAPVVIVAGADGAEYHAFAKKDGKKVWGPDVVIEYKIAGSMLYPQNPSTILDTELFWAVSGDSWTEDTASPHNGESAYKCDPTSACSLKTIVNVDGDNKALTFYHKDNFVDENASFKVLVDGVQVWSTNGAITVQSDWVRSSVPINSGSHTVEFRFTGNGSTLYLDDVSIGEKTTSTENDAYPVPYSWFSLYDDTITDGDVESRAKTKASNNLNTWWECYVLGLDPTNGTSKLVTTIRMVGTTPVVEYSPTNEVLKTSKAIEYVLQGKPALSNDWQDVGFDEPGDTNRFFRIKVEWK